MTPQEWVKTGEHLPDFLKDHHAAKDFFKLLHRHYGEKTEGAFVGNDGSKTHWVQGQCYVLDWFLWFCAQHGYTLQRTKKKFTSPVGDLADRIAEMKKEDAAVFMAYMAERRAEREAKAAQAGTDPPG